MGDLGFESLNNLGLLIGVLAQMVGSDFLACFCGLLDLLEIESKLLENFEAPRN